MSRAAPRRGLFPHLWRLSLIHISSGLLPFGFEAFEEGIRAFLPPKVVDVNLKAAARGREILAASRLF